MRKLVSIVFIVLVVLLVEDFLKVREVANNSSEVIATSSFLISGNEYLDEESVATENLIKAAELDGINIRKYIGSKYNYYADTKELRWIKNNVHKYGFVFIHFGNKWNVEYTISI